VVDVANCTDVEMRFFALEFATCGTDGERWTVVIGLGSGSEVEDCGRVKE
jgi:hypothetical protein